MTCLDCVYSKKTVWHAFTASCKGCQARALSRSPAFFESRESKKQTSSYRQTLRNLDLTHEQVLQAHESDKLNQRETVVA